MFPVPNCRLCAKFGNKRIILFAVSVAIASGSYILTWKRVPLNIAPSNTQGLYKSPLLVLTTFGWHHRDRETSLKHPQTLWSYEMEKSVLKNPRFAGFLNESATLTEDSYVFLDVEHCLETNWPVYGKHGRMWANWNAEGGRQRGRRNLLDYCTLLPGLLARLTLRSVVIIFNCRANYTASATCPIDQNGNRDPRVVVLPIAAHFSDFKFGVDIGLPALPNRPVSLNAQEREERVNCEHDYRFLFGYSGSLRKQTVSRMKLLHLHDGKRVWTQKLSEATDDNLKQNLNTSEPTYIELLKESAFAGVPRGDSLFSYRLLEVMSAGAIPVIYSDGWVLPFEDVISWSDFAVVINEADAEQTITIIGSISNERQCAMRRTVMHVYKTYFSGMDALLQTILSILDGRHRQESI